MLSIAQVAEQAGMSVTAVHKACREGRISGAVQVDIRCKNGKTKKNWRIPENSGFRRMSKEEISRAASERIWLARKREEELAKECPKWVPGRSDPVSYVWRNSSAKSVRQLAGEMGVSCGAVKRFFDMALARYAG